MPDWAKSVADWAGLIVVIAAVTGILGGAGRRAVRFIRSRRKPLPVWQSKAISGSHRLPDGGSVPMGEYHCLRAAHILDLDYPAARGHSPACGHPDRPYSRGTDSSYSSSILPSGFDA
jgi:hypothetical protein